MPPPDRAALPAMATILALGWAPEHHATQVLLCLRETPLRPRAAQVHYAELCDLAQAHAKAIRKALDIALTPAELFILTP